MHAMSCQYCVQHQFLHSLVCHLGCLNPKALPQDLAAPRPGETIYKGHRSYDLMRNLQMGILFSIAKTNREASERAAEPGPIDYRSEVHD